MILACLLTVLSVLWAPDTGYRLQAVNETSIAVRVSAVRIVHLKPGARDTGDVPNPKNYMTEQFDTTSVQLKDTGVRVDSVMPGQEVYINFDAPFDSARVIDGDAVCEPET